MCIALARACGGTPAWAAALLRDHPRMFDAFWRASFTEGRQAAKPRPAPSCDIDEILGRT